MLPIRVKKTEKIRQDKKLRRHGGFASIAACQDKSFTSCYIPASEKKYAQKKHHRTKFELKNNMILALYLAGMEHVTQQVVGPEYQEP